jgi:hypothetical protein
MLRTPVSAKARVLNAGQRSSAVRSSVWNTRETRIASRQGPWSVSYWTSSTRTGTSLLAAGVNILPSWSIVIPACSQPATVATANSTIFCNVSCADVSACSARATSAIAYASP